jgi:tripartite-type tricarboxylate transporter receptor subunit TctC
MQEFNRFHVRRRLLAGGSLLAAGALHVPGAVWAQAEAWPSKPVRVVVNFPPGSSPDVLARAVSLPLQQALGQPVVVENRAGASGMIGAEVVAKAPADGHTLLMTAGSTISTNPFIYPKIPYDTAKDFVPVAATARIVLFLVAKTGLPVKDVREFLAYLKAHPGKLSYGSAGNGTGPHLAG